MNQLPPPEERVDLNAGWKVVTGRFAPVKNKGRGEREIEIWMGQEPYGFLRTPHARPAGNSVLFIVLDLGEERFRFCYTGSPSLSISPGTYLSGPWTNLSRTKIDRLRTLLDQEPGKIEVLPLMAVLAEDMSFDESKALPEKKK